MQHSSCCEEDRLMALSTVAHHLVFSLAQVRRLCLTFRGRHRVDLAALVGTPSRVRTASPEVGQHFQSPFPTGGRQHLASPSPAKQRRQEEAEAHERQERLRRERERREAEEAAARKRLQEVSAKRSAFQYHFEDCRSDAFVLLFNRCHEPPALCTDACLYDPGIFTTRCVEGLRERLGCCRTLDVLHCCQLSAIDAVEAGSESLCSLGYVGSGGRRYHLRLDVHDEWTVMKFLVLLADKEPGVNIVKCSWSD
jgi:hypothetical protein